MAAKVKGTAGPRAKVRAQDSMNEDAMTEDAMKPRMR
jgi:hypothetical protein